MNIYCIVKHPEIDFTKLIGESDFINLLAESVADFPDIDVDKQIQESLTLLNIRGTAAIIQTKYCAYVVTKLQEYCYVSGTTSWQ